jgi:site-specific recombinase XerD
MVLLRRSDLNAAIHALDIDICPLDIIDEALAALDHYAVQELTPILLTDRWELDERLTDFAARMRLIKRSPLTAETYAREANLFSRYLRSRGKDLATASEADFWSYRALRLQGPSTSRLQPNTWNKVCAALLELARYLKISCEELKWSTFRASYESDDRVRMICLADYLTFSRIGMGTAPRSPLRNVAFSEFLVTTGARCTESSLLLRYELPALRSFGTSFSVELGLSPQITKRRKARNILYSKRVCRDFIEPYINEERSNIVGKTLKRSIYREKDLPFQSRFIFFQRETPAKARIIAGSQVKSLIPFDRFTMEERTKLIEVQLEPGNRYRVVDVGALWLSEQGFALSRRAWEAAFAAACGRVLSKTGQEIHVVPHVLRHTFAVHQLNFQLRGLVEIRHKSRLLDRRGEVFDRLVGDPLRELQRRLGHRSIATTYKYLKFVEDNQELVDRAIREWDTVLS